jgi:hypothetical protein
MAHQIKFMEEESDMDILDAPTTVNNKFYEMKIDNEPITKSEAYFLPVMQFYYCIPCAQLPIDILMANAPVYDFQTVFEAMHSNSLTCPHCKTNIQIKKSPSKEKTKQKIQQVYGQH